MMKIATRFRNAAAALAVAIILGAPGTSAVADDKLVDVEKSEYDGACAVCHGVTGKGNGPAAGQLAKLVPDLTGLARNNKGIFPFDRVYQIIDGRQEIKCHGPRDMLIWGQAFKAKSSRYFENSPVQDSQSATRSRILALTESVYRLQAK